MLAQLISKIYLLIIVWALANTYLSYEEHNEEMNLLRSGIPGINIQIKRKQKKIKELIDHYSPEKMEEAEEKVRRVAEQVKKLQKQLPEKVANMENLDLISTTAKKLNIKNIFLTPKKEQVHGFYLSKTYDFKGVGTFLQFLIFLEKFSSIERLFNIDSISLKSVNVKQKGRFQLVNGEIKITSYTYNTTYQEEELQDDKAKAKTKK